MKMTKITFITIALLMTFSSCSSGDKEASVSDDRNCSSEEILSYSEIYPLTTECDYYEDYEEYEDIDLSAQATYYTSEGNCIYVTRDEYGNISGHDLNGNFISGYSDQYGNTTIHDMNGNYVYSYTDGYGNTTSHDMDGNYSYSYTDGYGNTTGHDINGNYYSAYTDDFGYTTITSY